MSGRSLCPPQHEQQWATKKVNQESDQESHQESNQESNQESYQESKKHYKTNGFLTFTLACFWSVFGVVLGSFRGLKKRRFGELVGSPFRLISYCECHFVWQVAQLSALFL
jgi:hypothetical protein